MIAVAVAATLDFESAPDEGDDDADDDQRKAKGSGDVLLSLDCFLYCSVNKIAAPRREATRDEAKARSWDQGSPLASHDEICSKEMTQKNKSAQSAAHIISRAC